MRPSSGYKPLCVRAGVSIKASCHKRDGKFRLAYLKSEDVVIELER